MLHTAVSLRLLLKNCVTLPHIQCSLLLPSETILKKLLKVLTVLLAQMYISMYPKLFIPLLRLLTVQSQVGVKMFLIFLLNSMSTMILAQPTTLLQQQQQLILTVSFILNITTQKMQSSLMNLCQIPGLSFIMTSQMLLTAALLLFQKPAQVAASRM